MLAGPDREPRVRISKLSIIISNGSDVIGHVEIRAFVRDLGHPKGVGGATYMAGTWSDVCSTKAPSTIRMGR